MKHRVNVNKTIRRFRGSWDLTHICTLLLRGVKSSVTAFLNLFGIIALCSEARHTLPQSCRDPLMQG